MTCGIYLLTFGETNYYIGLSIDIELRFKQHIKSFSNETCTDKLLNAYQEYGVPTLKILEEAPREKLSYLEVMYIKKYNSFISGLNSNSGGALGSATIDIFEDIMFNKLKAVLLTYTLNKVSTLRLAEYIDISENIVINLLTGKKYIGIRDAFPTLYDSAIAMYSHNNNNKVQYPTLINSKGEEYKLMRGEAASFARANGIQPSNLSKLLKGELKRCGDWRRAY